MFDHEKQDKFDALVADWIGQIGQLHKEIGQLPAALDGAADREMKRACDEAVRRLSNEVYKQNVTATHSNANMWLAAATGALLAFVAGLAVRFESVSQLLMGTFIFILGGASCFFYFWHKRKNLSLCQKKKS